MNCPSRTDDLTDGGWNQNPPALAADLTTRNDLNGIANLRLQRDCLDFDAVERHEPPDKEIFEHEGNLAVLRTMTTLTDDIKGCEECTDKQPQLLSDGSPQRHDANPSHVAAALVRRSGQILLKFSKFIGPGFMVSVAYIDPGNYSTDVAAGASDRFRLLFVVLLSNIFAIVLQVLAVRLGTITGLNLAEHCRLFLPKWLNIFLYILAEAAIIATDIAEVIGSAIALNLLLKIPIVAGCALTLVDVLIILLFYNPSGSMRRLRAFEYCIVALVLAVVVCFCIQLSLITNTSVGEVFMGYLPSSAVVKGQGLYLSCGILGATVMPHSLYLGSGMVQARLHAFDKNAELTSSASSETLHPLDVDAAPHVLDVSANTQVVNQEPALPSEKDYYKPSLAAIKSCLNYSTAELALSLSLFALFVNSAILIVAGASLSNNPDAETASLFGIHDLLSSTIAPAAGTIFALALLLSGTSAGIICTIAGQMVSEGALNWSITPWLRRLITRCISITPSIIIAAAVGQDGLTAALNASQVALSIILPFVSAPLIYFTCRNKYMTVGTTECAARDEIASRGHEQIGMRNHWIMSVAAVGVWMLVTIMNVALLVLLGLGNA
ncbi:hypothetical protein MMC11_004482 [Xylographa trunciseda]|nr:hypothetical protein [Xylographa trunciseda]